MSNNQVPPHLAQSTAPAGNHTQSSAGFEQQVIELKRQQKELEKAKQSLNGAMTREQIAQELKRDRNGFLKGFGIELPEDPNEVPEHIREFKELKAQLEADKKAAADREYRDSILGKVKTDEKFELLNKLGNYDYVFDEISKRRGSEDDFDPLSLFEQAEQGTWSQVEALLESKKVQEYLKSKQQSAAPVSAPQGNRTHPMDASRTLSSNDRASSSAPVQSERPLSRAESLARIAAKYGNNNNPQGI